MFKTSHKIKNSKELKNLETLRINSNLHYPSFANKYKVFLALLDDLK